MGAVGFEPQQRSLLCGAGPWKLEVEIRVEGHVFAGAIYEDSAEKIEALYRTYCAAPAALAVLILAVEALENALAEIHYHHGCDPDCEEKRHKALAAWRALDAPSLGY